jgi:alkylated DNA repair dioxygenase AlkB
MQFDLFNNFQLIAQSAAKTINDLQRLESIEGLTYVPDYLSESEGNALWRSITGSPWLTDIRRRVQHYGWKYDYRNRFIDYSSFLGPLPPWAQPLGERLTIDGYLKKKPDQLIVNEYLPGQGIANHVDCKPCFEETIISVSLGSRCVMDFINLRTKEKIEVLLEPHSLVVISGESRYNWSHGIPSRKTDQFAGESFERALRISLTFRNVIVQDACNLK